MEGFDIDVFGTIRRWPRWKQRVMLIASIILLAWGFAYFIWFAVFLNNPVGILAR